MNISVISAYLYWKSWQSLYTDFPHILIYCNNGILLHKGLYNTKGSVIENTTKD